MGGCPWHHPARQWPSCHLKPADWLQVLSPSPSCSWSARKDPLCAGAVSTDAGRWSREEIVTGLCSLSWAERQLGWMWSTQEGFLEEVASKLRLEVG